MIAFVLIILAGICALLLSLIGICKIGYGDFYHLRRIDHVPHVWAFITATTTFAAAAALGASAGAIYAFTLPAVFLGFGAASPALDYMWCAGHLPNS